MKIGEEVLITLKVDKEIKISGFVTCIDTDAIWVNNVKFPKKYVKFRKITTDKNKT